MLEMEKETFINIQIRNSVPRSFEAIITTTTGKFMGYGKVRNNL